ncbi:sericin 1-like [Xenopus tropicalis]|uniref:Sericin 1-like n=1 Tax=Xenopus tropicalis TaxID=8364 RepID=A0A803JR13_XENTR|nr:sericin 1-like [Xenopus tropicalis]
MRFLLGLISFVIAFAAVDSSLLCTECRGEMSCMGANVTCAGEEYCVSWFTVETNGGNATKSLIRSCAPVEQCDFSASIRVTNGSVKIVSSCCDTDNCTPQLPPLPADSPQTLGIMCPACTASQFSSCSSEETIQCGGRESRCIEYSSSSGNSTKAVRGCAPRSSCGPDGLDGPEPLSVNISGFHFTFNCTDAEIIDSPISCTECNSSDSSSCSGNNVTCPPGYACITHHKVEIQDGAKTESIVRTCGMQSSCEDSVRKSLPGYTLIDSTTCCYTNNCTPAIKLHSNQTNGLTCKTCTAENTDTCDNEQTMECSGDENMCYAELTLLSESLQYVYGCATKGICGRVYPSEDATVSYTCQIPKAMSMESTTASAATGTTWTVTVSAGTGPTGNTTISVGTGPTGNSSTSVGTGPTGNSSTSVGTGPTGNSSTSVGTGPTGNSSTSVGTGPTGNSSTSVGTGPTGSTSEGIKNTSASLGSTVGTTGSTTGTTKSSTVLANTGNPGVTSASTKISSRRIYVGVFFILYMYFAQ